MMYIKNLKDEMLKDRNALSEIVSNLEVENIESAQKEAVKRLYNLEAFIEADMKRLMS